MIAQLKAADINSIDHPSINIARQEIAEVAGHSRDSISRAYIG